MTISRTAWLTFALALGMLAFQAVAHAQPVYRIVGPDGKVTFSDRAPETLAPGARTSTLAPVATGSDTSALPFELRQVVQRFPVTL